MRALSERPNRQTASRKSKTDVGPPPRIVPRFSPGLQVRAQLSATLFSEFTQPRVFPEGPELALSASCPRDALAFVF